MSNSVSKKLALVKNLINKGKYEEALQQVKDIEQKENLSPEETLRILEKKGSIFFYLGQLELALKIAENLYETSQKMKMPLFSLDALYRKEMVFYFQQKFEECFESIELHETLFKSIPREESLEFQEREAYLLNAKAMRDYNKGKLDLALNYRNRSLMFFEQTDPHSVIVWSSLMAMAYAYDAKGEINLALECAEKALSLIPERANFILMSFKAAIYRIMGSIYYQKGDLNRALKYRKLDLEILKKYKISQWMITSYALIIAVLLAKKDVNQAQHYLQQIKQLNEKQVSKLGNLHYQGARALILKSSSRMRDRTEAETILKKIIKESPEINLINTALIILCDLYFEEFRIFNQMDILNDVYPLIDHLQRNAELENSYSLLANVKLLQGKLALLQINITDARKYLTEAQNIAVEHDFQLLAGEISKEHDRLLEELKLWESFKKEQASVAERMKLASIDEVLERMQRKRAIELPEFDIEEPILLLIMDKSGVTYFNYSFVENWDFSDLFSSFMSAFNTFSSEIFSRSIDRIKIGENTILINPIEPFLACYVIKGQSYPAQQKLAQFSDAIKATTEIWEALNRAAKTSEMLELDNPPSLGNTVNEIFIK